MPLPRLTRRPRLSISDTTGSRLTVAGMTTVLDTDTDDTATLKHALTLAAARELLAGFAGSAAAGAPTVMDLGLVHPARLGHLLGTLQRAGVHFVTHPDVEAVAATACRFPRSRLVIVHQPLNIGAAIAALVGGAR